MVSEPIYSLVFQLFMVSLAVEITACLNARSDHAPLKNIYLDSASEMSRTLMESSRDRNRSEWDALTQNL